jgi:hypothetical protein
VRRI